MCIKYTIEYKSKLALCLSNIKTSVVSVQNTPTQRSKKTDRVQCELETTVSGYKDIMPHSFYKRENQFF